MAERRASSAPEYRRRMVERVRAGRTSGEIAREFGCSSRAIRNRVRQADRDEGRREDGLTSVEREELRRSPSRAASLSGRSRPDVRNGRKRRPGAGAAHAAAAEAAG